MRAEHYKTTPRQNIYMYLHRLRFSAQFLSFWRFLFAKRLFFPRRFLIGAGGSGAPASRWGEGASSFGPKSAKDRLVSATKESFSGILLRAIKYKTYAIPDRNPFFRMRTEVAQRGGASYLSHQIGANREIPRATCNLPLRAQEQVPGG